MYSYTKIVLFWGSSCLLFCLSKYSFCCSPETSLIWCNNKLCMCSCCFQYFAIQHMNLLSTHCCTCYIITQYSKETECFDSGKKASWVPFKLHVFMLTWNGMHPFGQILCDGLAELAGIDGLRPACEFVCNTSI